MLPEQADVADVAGRKEPGLLRPLFAAAHLSMPLFELFVPVLALSVHPMGNAPPNPAAPSLAVTHRCSKLLVAVDRSEIATLHSIAAE